MTAPALTLEQPRRWPPATGFVIDKRGNPVDVTATVWRLNDAITPLTLDWAVMDVADGPVLDALQSYITSLIKRYATSTVSNAFRRLLHLTGTNAFKEAVSTGSPIPFLAFSEARANLGTGQWQLHDARAMYRWCVQQRFHGFDPHVLSRIEGWTFGGNKKGTAVRSADPKNGPLTRQEVASIVLALKAARLAGGMPLEEQAAVALCLTAGANAGQYASMREEDVKPLYSNDKLTRYVLSVPRHKKGLDYYREEFRQRPAGTLCGSILSELLVQNGSTPHPTDNLSRPLFRRASAPRHDRNDEAEWKYHIARQDFTELLKRAVARLGVLGRDGEPLHVNTRRFRYTKATTMKRNGASRAAVADALDHTDLQNVEVYWDIDSDIVEFLDKTVALALAPTAQAFAGVVRREKDAVRGADRSSRRYLADRETGKFEPIGTCGSFSFCNIIAPLACYTCVKFQAWMDGPHQEVLELLLAARQKRAERGLDPKMVAIEDEIITGVVGVIARIERMNAQEPANDD